MKSMENLYNDHINKKEKISVIGLGYVGLPVAIEVATKYDVIGFDINKDKVNTYREGTAVTNEVVDEELQKSSINFSTNAEAVKQCKFHIVAVPTSMHMDKTPHLAPS